MYSAEVFYGAAEELHRTHLMLLRATGLAATAAHDMEDEPGQYYGYALEERGRALLADVEAARQALEAWEPVRPAQRDLPPLPEPTARPVSRENRRERAMVARLAGSKLCRAEADLRRAARRMRAVAAAGLRDEPMPLQVRQEIAGAAARAEQLADATAVGRTALSWCVPATRRAVWAERAARWRAGRAYWSWLRASRRAEAAASART